MKIVVETSTGNTSEISTNGLRYFCFCASASIWFSCWSAANSKLVANNSFTWPISLITYGIRVTILPIVRRYNFIFVFHGIGNYRWIGIEYLGHYFDLPIGNARYITRDPASETNLLSKILDAVSKNRCSQISYWAIFSYQNWN